MGKNFLGTSSTLWIAYIDCDYTKSSGLKNPNGCLHILVLHSNNTQAVWKIVIVVLTFYGQGNKDILYVNDPYNYVLWTFKKTLHSELRNH